MVTHRRTILVTGGTGFTGSHLVRRLLAKSHNVRVVDNQKGLFYDELVAQGAQITLGSVADRELMDRVVKGCEVILHVAAAFRKVNLPGKVYWDINVNGTRYLLESAYRHGIEKFVYCSTQGVHGHVTNPPGDETTPIVPEDYYQFTKYEGEKVAQEFIEKGLNVTILRPTAIYGPGDAGRWLMLFKQASTGRFPMFGSGRVTYHPLYIDNLVNAFELAVEKAEAQGQTYIIGDEHYYTLNDLVIAVGKALNIDVSIVHLPFWPLWGLAVVCEAVCAPLRIAPPLFRRRVDWYRQVRAFDISKAKQELGYRPQIDLATGLARTAHWYRQHAYL